VNRPVKRLAHVPINDAHAQALHPPPGEGTFEAHDACSQRDFREIGQRTELECDRVGSHREDAIATR
jgi:hypothetical protein